MSEDAFKDIHFIDIEKVLKIERLRGKTAMLNLRHCVFTYKGKVIEPSEELIEMFDMAGLILPHFVEALAEEKGIHKELRNKVELTYNPSREKPEIFILICPYCEEDIWKAVYSKWNELAKNPCIFELNCPNCEKSVIVEEKMIFKIIKPIDIPKKVKTERIKAWLYGVINPILESAISCDNCHLEKQDWSWDFLEKKCKFISHFKDCLSHDMGPNYDDFCMKYPEIAEKFDCHDKQVDALSKASEKLFETLSHSEQFLAKVKETLQIWIQEGNFYPGGAYPKDQFPMLMAGDVVNNIQKLPEHYRHAAFWQRFGKEFIALAPQDLIQENLRIGKDLLDFNKNLAKDLKELRLSFCDEFDIPPAPLISHED